MSIWLVRAIMPDGTLVPELRWLVVMPNPPGLGVNAWNAYNKAIYEKVAKSQHFNHSCLPNGYELTAEIVEFGIDGVARIEH